MPASSERSQMHRSIGSTLVSYPRWLLIRGLLACAVPTFAGVAWSESDAARVGAPPLLVRAVYLPMWQGVSALATLPADRVNHLLLTFCACAGRINWQRTTRCVPAAATSN